MHRSSSETSPAPCGVNETRARPAPNALGGDCWHSGRHRRRHAKRSSRLNAILRDPAAKCPLSDPAGKKQHSRSFDDLVGAAEQRQRKGEAERLGGLQIEDELEPGGMYHRQLARLGALEDAVNVKSRAPRDTSEI